MSKKNHGKENVLIGQRVQSVRMMNNLTQDNLGDLLGVTGQAVHKLEVGENSLTVNSLKIICDKFGVSADYIMFGKADTPRDFELSFETLTGDEKVHLLMRLLVYLCKVDNEKYRKMLEEVIDSLKE